MKFIHTPSIIGLTGANGAGKDTVAAMLAAELHRQHMKSMWRVTREGIQAMPITDPHQWGPDAYDFDSLELARFASLLNRGSKPRVHYRQVKPNQKR